MKRLIKIIAVLAIFASAAHAERYPETAIVTHLNYKNDVVTIQTFNGNIWEFEGCEDWCINDMVSLIMDNNGTPDIHDDIIIDAKYSGWIEQWFNQRITD